ncbi:MAG: M23 family metallopeptidase [Anaerolineae bacterium]|nr:M23 family metallopeptidase [Anaerolineae bacterium]
MIALRTSIPVLLLLSTAILLAPDGAAQAAPPGQTPRPPFGLPLEGPPGAGRWVVGQFYGNTQGAYRYREEWYRAGQGLHFGVDFSVRCGTPVLAIGDGEVSGIDRMERGAGPHNLLIYHPEGYISLYGHLLEAPAAYIGMPVKRGQVVAFSGDPDGTCASRPHLHLEIRSLDHGIAYNPVMLIDADWQTLALIGPRSSFETDLAEPRRWQTIADQPTVDFWAGPLNHYARPWPPDWE